VSGEYSDDDILIFSSVTNAFGINTFTLWLTDGIYTSSVPITVAVNSINNIPLILGDIQSNPNWNQNEDFGTFQIDLSTNESDVESSGIYLDWFVTGLNISLVTVSGEYSDNDILVFSSVSNAFGIDTFTLWLTDGIGTSSVTITITINSINDIPVILGDIQSNPIWTQEEDFGTIQIDLSTNESDVESSGTSLDWYITGLNISLVTVSGEYSDDDILIFYSVANTFGTDIFTLWLSDGTNTDSILISIVVNSINDIPVILGDIQSNPNWNQNEDFGTFQIDLSTNGSDVESSGIYLDWFVTGLDMSLISISGEYSDDDILVFSSVSDAFGTDIFVLTLTDGEDEESVTITFTINSINDIPVILGDIQSNPNWNQNEDFGSFQIDLSTNGSDVESSGVSLDWYILGVNNSLITVSGEYSDNDILTFSSVENVFGTNVFALLLTDGTDTDSISISITVDSVNDMPVILGDIQSNPNWTQNEDFGTFQIDLSTNESDVESSGVSLDWFITELDSSLVTILGEYSDNDLLVFNSVVNAFGTDTFTLWLTDGVNVNSVQITVIVNSINNIPVILGDIQSNPNWTQNEDFGIFLLDLSSNEFDVESTGNDLDWYTTGLNTSLVTVSGEYSDNDILAFSSVPNVYGIDAFTLWLTDGEDESFISLAIIIISVNDVPIIIGDIQSNPNWTQNEDFGTFQIDLSAYESDVESSGIDLDWYIMGLDTSLVLISGEYSDNNVIVFYSVPDAYGTDSFSLWLTDGENEIPVTISITVISINDVPIILGDIQNNPKWTENEDFGTFLIDLSTNESDVENSGTLLDWYITGLNTSLVTVSGDYSDDDILVFTSIEDVSGMDTFILWLTDGEDTDLISIAITINPVNDIPVILGDIQDNLNWTQNEDFGTFQIDLSMNEFDIESSGVSLDWYITDLNTSLVTVSGEYSDDDILVFNSVANAFGTNSFTLWLTDGEDAEPVEITIIIVSINDVPVILGNIQNNLNWIQFEDFGTFQIDLSMNESDVDNSSTSLDWYVTGLNTSLVSLSGENSDDDILIFNSIQDVFGSDTFILWLTDGMDTDSVELTIVVDSVNDAPIILGDIQSNTNWTQDEDFGTFIIDFSTNESDVESSGTFLDWYITGLDTSLVSLSGEFSDNNILIFNSVTNAFGTDTFILWLSDGENEDSLSITISIASINDIPVILGDIQNNPNWT